MNHACIIILTFIRDHYKYKAEYRLLGLPPYYHNSKCAVGFFPGHASLAKYSFWVQSLRRMLPWHCPGYHRDCSKVDYYDCVCIKSSAENHKVLILSTAAS